MKAVKINNDVIIFGDDTLPDEYTDIAVDVPEMPECPQICSEDYIFDIVDGKLQYVYNGIWKNVSIDDMKVRLRELNNLSLADHLASHPIKYTDGKYYGVTFQDQQEITLNITQYQLALIAGSSAILEWHSVGEECVEWSIEDLTMLALTISQYVYPFIRKCQEYKVKILNAESKEELLGMSFEY